MKNSYIFLFLLQIVLMTNASLYGSKHLNLLERYLSPYLSNDDYDDDTSSEEIYKNTRDLYNAYNDDLFDSNEDLFRNDEESEIYSPLLNGYQYVSGGAGEGKQNLKPNGDMPNKHEIKSDLLLPAYCAPINPCPIGYIGSDCDRRPYEEYTAELSKSYQSRQNCACDTDHNECDNDFDVDTQSKIQVDELRLLLDALKSNVSTSIVAKKSPRIRRNAEPRIIKKLNGRKIEQPLKFHVAKKSPQI